MIKVGLNKILVEDADRNDFQKENGILLPEKLRQYKYKVVTIGKPRTTYDNTPDINVGELVSLTPNAGYPLKVSGREYLVVSYDDVLAVNV